MPNLMSPPGSEELLGPVSHELLLRVDVVPTPAAERRVVEDERLAVRPELARPDSRAARENRLREAVRLQQLDRAVLDHSGLHARAKPVGPLSFQDDERNAGALKQVGDGQASRSGPDDAHHRIPRCHERAPRSHSGAGLSNLDASAGALRLTSEGDSRRSPSVDDGRPHDGPGRSGRCSACDRRDAPEFLRPHGDRHSARPVREGRGPTREPASRLGSRGSRPAGRHHSGGLDQRAVASPWRRSRLEARAFETPGSAISSHPGISRAR